MVNQKFKSYRQRDAMHNLGRRRYIHLGLDDACIVSTGFLNPGCDTSHRFQNYERGGVT